MNINNNSLYAGAHGIALAVINPHAGLTGMKFRCIMKSTDPSCGLARDTSEIATLYVGNYNTTTVADAVGDKFDVTLYPNPVNGNELFINTANIPVSNIHVKIYDKLGRVLYDADAQVTNKTVTVPVQNLPSGIYSIQITDANKNLLNTSSFSRQ